jgi:hypothetical protein
VASVRPIGGQRQIATAFQQRINVAPSLGLLKPVLGLKAVLGYDLVEEVAVTRQRGKGSDYIRSKRENTSDRSKK